MTLQSNASVESFCAARDALDIYVQAFPEKIADDQLVAVGDLLNDKRFSNSSPKVPLGYYQRALAKGDRIAAARLGDLYFRGEGVGQSYSEAAAYYEQAPGGVPKNALLPIADAFLAAQQDDRAKQYLELAAKADVEGAKRKLADLLLSGGDLVPPDPSRAIALYVEIGKAGDGACAELAGDLLSAGAAVPKDEVAAINAYDLALADGSTTAAAKLGLMWLNGVAGKIDLAKADTYFAQSPQGYPDEALLSLGTAFRDGKDVARNLQEAAKLLGAAVDRGLHTAELELARLYLSDGAFDPARAEPLLTSASDDIPASFWTTLASAYRDGNGVLADGAKAVTYFEKALDQGELSAATSVASIYLNGVGVERDPELAATFAGRAGNNLAAHDLLALGRALSDPKINDDKGAAKYLQLALNAGAVEAQLDLARLHVSSNSDIRDAHKAASYLGSAGDVAPVDLLDEVALALLDPASTYADQALSATLFEQAASRGDVTKLGQLANLYLGGGNLKSDPAKAEQYFLKAIAAGDQSLRLKLAELYLGPTFGENRTGEAYGSLHAASLSGDGAATRRLIELYLSGNYDTLFADDKNGRELRATARSQLPADDEMRADLLVDAVMHDKVDIPGAIEEFWSIAPAERSRILPGLATGHDRLVVSVAQQLLADRQLYQGPVDGSLGKSTVRAFMRMCAAIKSPCPSGPLSVEGITALAAALAIH